MSNVFDEMMEREVKKILESESESKKTSINRKSVIVRRNNRARIGRCLYELKQMLLNCNPDLLSVRRDGPRPGAMETVDIMEMTLDHMRHLTNKVNRGGSRQTEEASSGSVDDVEVHWAKPEDVLMCEADSTSPNDDGVRPVRCGSSKKVRVDKTSTVFRPWQT